jgi:2-amino-4-hydroxy-6-hydroxymethyldihydropteridine diphosphokinase
VARVRNGIGALRALGEVVAVSSLYVTKPWGRADQPDFINAAASLETALAPRALLLGLKSLERELGRGAEEDRWGPRRIDFDILIYGDRTIDDGDLVIPHRRLFQRAFALVPLAEIAPEYRSTLESLPVSELDGVKLLPL